MQYFNDGMMFSKFNMKIILASWIVAFLFPISSLFNNRIKYDVDNQICQIPLKLSVILLPLASYVYLVPISLMIGIYSKIIQYVRQINRRHIVINTMVRAKRELKMICPTFILSSIIIITEFPYTLFYFYLQNRFKFH